VRRNRSRQKAGGRRRKYRKNRNSVPRLPPPVFLFAATNSTASTSNTSTEPLQRGKNTVDGRNEIQRKQAVRRSRGEKKEKQRLPPQPGAATSASHHLPPPAATPVKKKKKPAPLHRREE
jgi:hypothetical protein